MRAYALTYRFTDASVAANFREATVKAFKNIQEHNESKLPYLGFAARKEPEVEDKLTAIISNIIHRYTLQDSDYVALYFSQDHNPDEIVRQMVFGTEETIQREINDQYRPRHISIITDLLEYDPVRQ